MVMTTLAVGGIGRNIYMFTCQIRGNLWYGNPEPSSI